MEYINADKGLDDWLETDVLCGWDEWEYDDSLQERKELDNDN